MTGVSPTVGAFLGTIFNLQEDRIPVRRARICDRLGLAGATVTQAVNRMIDADLVRLRHDQYVELTDEGRKIAITVVRRHRLTERLLTDVLKVPAQQAHAEANAWGHTISENTERAIAASLDDPSTSPWGNPIPGLDELGITARVTPEPTLLYQLGPQGETVSATVRCISEDAQDDPELAEALVGAGIVPGAQVRIRVAASHYEILGLSRYDIPANRAHVVQLDVPIAR